MADVTFDVEVEGNAARGFDAIAAAAGTAGAAAEDAAESLRSIPALKVDADIAAFEIKLQRLRAERDTLTDGSLAKIKIDADIALAEAKLAELRQDAQSTGRAVDTAGWSSTLGWASLGGVLTAAAGMTFALGSAAVVAGGVAALAFHGWSDGMWQATSAGQSLHSELVALSMGPIADLQRAAQQGLLPGITKGLQEVKPAIEDLKDPIKVLAAKWGEAVGAMMGIFAPLTKDIIAFADAASMSLNTMNGPLRTVESNISSMLQEMTKSGQAEQAATSLLQAFMSLLQMIPPLIQVATTLAAALGPGIAGAVSVLVGLLGPLLNSISAHVQVWSKLVEMLILAWAAAKAFTLIFVTLPALINGIGAAVKGAATMFGLLATAETVAAEAGAEAGVVAAASPWGALVILIVAVIAVIALLVTHWDEVCERLRADAEKLKAGIQGMAATAKEEIQGLGEFFKSGGDAIKSVGDAIVGFFNGIAQALMSPRDAIATIRTEIQELIEFFKSVGDAIVGFFNGIAQALMSPLKAIASIGSWLSSPVDVNIQQSPGLFMASGGIVTRRTNITAGEDGAEAIIPLSSPRAREALGGGGPQVVNNYNINGVVGPPSAVVAAIHKASRSTQARGHGFGFA